jgi:hypothetical protein
VCRKTPEKMQKVEKEVNEGRNKGCLKSRNKGGTGNTVASTTKNEDVREGGEQRKRERERELRRQGRQTLLWLMVVRCTS